MKTNYLFPNIYKAIGWLVLIPSAIFGLIVLFTDYEPAFFDAPVLEIISTLVIIGLLFVAFSKEKHEDEYISKIRLESLVWAVYFNYGVLLFFFWFTYELTFFYVMVFNMFTVLLFFIIRFNWLVYKLKKQNRYEE